MPNGRTSTSNAGRCSYQCHDRQVAAHPVIPGGYRGDRADPAQEGARYLFASRTNPIGHLTSIKHAWQTARAMTKLGDLTIHDLPHAAASAMVSAGVDLFAVGRVLGHANHASTLRYSHLAPDTLLAAVEAGAQRQNVDWSS